MGDLRGTTIAIIITVVLVGFLANNVAYPASSDAYNRTTFIVYTEADNNTNAILSPNYTRNSTSVLNNFMLMGTEIEENIQTAQTQLNSPNPLDQLAGAFGLLTTITLGIFFFLLTVIIQTINVLAAVGTNLMNVPAPWNIVSYFTIMVSLVGFLYVLFSLINAYAKWNV